jgi:hypothetical protein
LTYQQSCASTPDKDVKDAENALLSRFNRQRLDYEQMHDATLSVCGSLNLANTGGRATLLTVADMDTRRSLSSTAHRHRPHPHRKARSRNWRRCCSSGTSSSSVIDDRGMHAPSGKSAAGYCFGSPQKLCPPFAGSWNILFECPVNPKSSSVLRPSLSMTGIGWARSWAGCCGMRMRQRM